MGFLIPRVDLAPQEKPLKREIEIAIKKTIEKKQFVLGESVKEFESALAKFAGTKFCVGVGSGTDALILSLLALGIKKGDEVITTPFTNFASTEAILRVGAKPVFVDIRKDTYNIDESLVKKVVTKKTKAILPVHLFGYPCNIKALKEIAEKNGLSLVEDNCQSLGAKAYGKKVGSFGDCSANSFFPTKNLGCYGDGGAVLTNNNELHEKVRILREHGQKRKYFHQIVGFNSRLDELQAAILNVKIKYLDSWITERRKLARKYSECFSSMQYTFPPVEEKGMEHTYHLYVIKALKRDRLKEFLLSKGIQTEIHYPLPANQQPALINFGIKGKKTPNAETACKIVLSLPFFVGLKEEQINLISNEIQNFYVKCKDLPVKKQAFTYDQFRNLLPGIECCKYLKRKTYAGRHNNINEELFDRGIFKHGTGNFFRILDIGVSPLKLGAPTTEDLALFLKKKGIKHRILAIDKFFPKEFNPRVKKIVYKKLNVEKHKIFGKFDLVRALNIEKWLKSPAKFEKKISKNVADGGYLLVDRVLIYKKGDYTDEIGFTILKQKKGAIIRNIDVFFKDYMLATNCIPDFGWTLKQAKKIILKNSEKLVEGTNTIDFNDY